MRRSETKILVVDDEQQVRDLFCESLGEAGQTCFSAAGGKEALGILAKEDIDLVIIDIIMPGMSGLSLFEHIKDRHPDVAAGKLEAPPEIRPSRPIRAQLLGP